MEDDVSINNTSFVRKINCSSNTFESHAQLEKKYIFLPVGSSFIVALSTCCKTFDRSKRISKDLLSVRFVDEKSMDLNTLLIKQEKHTQINIST